MRVLLAYDGSAGAETARALTAHLGVPAGSEIRVCAVIGSRSEVRDAADAPIVHSHVDEPTQPAVQHAELQLEAVAGTLRTTVSTVSWRILHGHPASALVAEARDWDADLVVVGNRGLGRLQSIVLGSVSAEIVDHAPCPVLVARRPVAHRILVGVDGSTSAHRAVATLCAWPMLRGIPCGVLGVVEPIPTWPMGLGGPLGPVVAEEATGADDDSARLVAAAVDDAVLTLRRAGFPTEGEVRHGDPAEQLIGCAAQHGCDLLVVGTRGLGMIGRLLLGSVARKVLLHSTVSVLVVRAVKDRVRSTEQVRSTEKVGRLATV